MHWIQTLREQLQITQEELGQYLQVSVHTVKSVESGRRALPPGSLAAAAALFDAIRNVSLAPAPATLYAAPALQYHTGRAKRLHRQCCHKLERSVAQLARMKKTHTAACLALTVYQTLAQALPTPVSKQEQARLTWAQRQVREAMLRINDTNPVAQELLAVEIVGLKNIAHGLDLIRLNAEHKNTHRQKP